MAAASVAMQLILKGRDRLILAGFDTIEPKKISLTENQETTHTNTCFAYHFARDSEGGSHAEPAYSPQAATTNRTQLIALPGSS
jgi:hypothetical protein